MFVSNDIKYIGVNDTDIDLFEGQYPVPDGMCYNSYVILDEKIAVLDTADQHFTDEWLENLKKVLDNRKPDYLLIHHMEPDHAANIKNFMDLYPDTSIVASAKAFSIMKQFFSTDYSENQIVVKDGSTLELGKHTLQFITAPMVHWPEVIMTYDSYDKALFTADAFGTFGTIDSANRWDDEARRYYIGIVGKYGVQVQNVLKKANNLNVQMICPLHGPVLKENLEHYFHLYDLWSSYTPEKDGVVIAYCSVYGHTKDAVILLKQKLNEKGISDVKVYDLARSDMFAAVADAFCYNKLVLAATTYNASVFPFMKEFIQHLTERNFQKHTVGFMENGSWAPMAAKVMKEMLASSKDINFTENNVRILSAVNDTNRDEISALADELCK